MKTVVFVVALVFVASACTSKTIPASATGTATSEEPAPRPSPTTTVSHAGLELGPRTSTAGWVVMADGFGVHVAGGGTLQNIDPVTGKSSSVVKVGSWDYDFIRLGRDGEGSLWLTSGHNLWVIAGSPHYAIGRQYNLHRLGYVGAVYQATRGRVADCGLQRQGTSNSPVYSRRSIPIPGRSSVGSILRAARRRSLRPPVSSLPKQGPE